MVASVHYIQMPSGETIAYAHYVPPQENAILIFYIPGYGAHKFSQKSLQLLKYAKQNGWAWASFDHLGCGESSGDMSEMGLEDYLAAAQRVLDALAPSQCLLVGSSFGGWLSVLLAERNPCIKGLIGIAGAYDFTRFIYSKLDPEHHEELHSHQRLILKLKTSDEDFVFSKKLVYQSREWYVLNREIQLTIPIFLLHGTADPDVPWQNSLTFMEKLTANSVKLVLIKDAGHRFLEPLARQVLLQETTNMVELIQGVGLTVD